MRTLSIGTSALALLLSASMAMAAPCNTDAAKGKAPEGSAGANTSATDKSSKNEAGGQQPASPGTVGALNNLGPNQGVTGPAAGEKKSDKEDPAAKNTAGGNQPASPGTVGAMNNTGTDQKATKDDNC